jgi:sulfatase modifying factor 1
MTVSRISNVLTSGHEPGGAFLVGSDKHYPEEAPAHRVRTGGFRVDRTRITNNELREFTNATRYVTLAEPASVRAELLPPPAAGRAPCLPGRHLD